MEVLGKLLESCSGSETYIQEEVFFYIAGITMWRKIFRTAYQNCEGCLYPHTLRHSCLFLWSYFSLKEQNWADKLFELYYDTSYAQLDWGNDFILENKVKDRVDLAMYKECYWQTRSRQKKLKMRVKEYIIAAAVEEVDSLISLKLKGAEYSL